APRRAARSDSEVEGVVETATSWCHEGAERRAARAGVALDRVVAEARDEEVAAGPERERRRAREAPRSRRDEDAREVARRGVELAHLAEEERGDEELPLVEREPPRVERPAAVAARVDEDAEEGPARAVVDEDLAGRARDVEVAVRAEGEAARAREAARSARHEEAQGVAAGRVEAEDAVRRGAAHVEVRVGAEGHVEGLGERGRAGVEELAPLSP